MKSTQGLSQTANGTEYYFNGLKIKPVMLTAIHNYVEQGIIPGNFLQAVITNDLFKAVGYADADNLVALPAFVGYFKWEVSGDCHGSKEIMQAWVEKRCKSLDESSIGGLS